MLAASVNNDEDGAGKLTSANLSTDTIKCFTKIRIIIIYTLNHLLKDRSTSRKSVVGVFNSSSAAINYIVFY